MRFKLVLLFMVVVALTIWGCEQASQGKILKDELSTDSQNASIQPAGEQQTDQVKVIEKTKEPVVVNLSCSVTADCAEGKQCIDKQCQTVAELYSTNCQQKCNYDNVVITTSDAETYTLSRGQGSYSYAGAIAWTLVPGPDYCPGEDIPIPIKVEKITTGKKLSEEVITLQVGETSGVIKHPTVQRVSFTMKVERIDEECS